MTKLAEVGTKFEFVAGNSDLVGTNLDLGRGRLSLIVRLVTRVTTAIEFDAG